MLVFLMQSYEIKANIYHRYSAKPLRLARFFYAETQQLHCQAIVFC